MKKKLLVFWLVSAALIPMFSTDYLQVIETLKRAPVDEDNYEIWELEARLDEFIDYTESYEIVSSEAFWSCSYNMKSEYKYFIRPIIRITSEKISISIEHYDPYSNFSLLHGHNYIKDLDPLDKITVKFRSYVKRDFSQEETSLLESDFNKLTELLILDTTKAFDCARVGGQVILSNEAALYFAKNLIDPSKWTKILIESGESSFIITTKGSDNLYKIINKLGNIPTQEREVVLSYHY